MDEYIFIIPGKAAPQGSKRFVGKSKTTGRAVLIEQSTKVKPWRTIVHAAATAAVAGQPPLEGAVGVDIIFYFDRPASARNRIHPFKAGPGDIDKLLRSTFDAFTTAKLWQDDAQVCEVHAKKRYAEDGTEARCYVRVWT